jgi:hypothetical protein
MNSNRGNLEVIKRHVQRHLKAGHPDPIAAGIADTYPGTGEVMARANVAYLLGETEEPNNVWIGAPVAKPQEPTMANSTGRNRASGKAPYRALTKEEAQQAAERNRTRETE